MQYLNGGSLAISFYSLQPKLHSIRLWVVILSSPIGCSSLQTKLYSILVIVSLHQLATILCRQNRKSKQYLNEYHSLTVGYYSLQTKVNSIGMIITRSSVISYYYIYADKSVMYLSNRHTLFSNRLLLSADKTNCTVFDLSDHHSLAVSYSLQTAVYSIWGITSRHRLATVLCRQNCTVFGW